MAKKNKFDDYTDAPQDTAESAAGPEGNVKDMNGNTLRAGDTVTIVKGLKVKGGKDIKQGTAVRNIRLTDDDGAIEGKVDGSVIVIKTIYVKKA